MKVNIGIIGFGKMGQIRAESIESSGLAKVITVFDENPIADTLYHTSPSIEGLINNSKLDAVFICTPNFLNKPLTIKALNAGKHVFCEKPPAFNALEIEEVRAAELESGKKLMYGFNHRHHGAVIKMKQEVDSGKYGKVLWMRGRYGKSVDESYFETWRADKELAGGGILLDQGIHMLDLFSYFGGSFDQIHAFVSSLYWELEGIEDNVFAILKNSQSGVVASLHSTMTQWRHLFSLEVFLESGYMVLNGLKTSSGTYGDEVLTIARNRSQAPAATWDDEESFTYPVDTSWTSEVNHFLQSIVEDKTIAIGNSSEALELMKLVDSIYENERDEAAILNRSLKPVK